MLTNEEFSRLCYLTGFASTEAEHEEHDRLVWKMLGYCTAGECRFHPPRPCARKPDHEGGHMCGQCLAVMKVTA